MRGKPATAADKSPPLARGGIVQHHARRLRLAAEWLALAITGALETEPRLRYLHCRHEEVSNADEGAEVG